MLMGGDEVFLRFLFNANNKNSNGTSLFSLFGCLITILVAVDLETAQLTKMQSDWEEKIRSQKHFAAS